MRAAVTPSDTARYEIGPLTTYADPEAMAKWLEAAAQGHEIVYATGPVLGDHAVARLARQWERSGKAALFQRRSTRAHCFDYCARKASAGPRTAPKPRGARGKDARGELSRLSRHLRSLAAQKRPCPSFADIARVLELPRGSRGRRRAQYLLETLESEGRVRIDRSDAKRPAIVIPNGRTRGARS
ncbi:hypothetical protein [Alteriqipengyuania lutimaris]|uniref:Uncharacterized protein n=1 Tax=Alteriqipengyuania lutimaris TaxID=1538146 RepID=A0A395LND7_9SPHN|nr:hypothetical protein [Alteriqipengyuania lutimaris]MBB3034030.1 hypothetical protein [Alteriqipengyuania lutimaris]RDS77024.1 hypothetical protein DL238_04965 [Alteriqipengyuania lutimaris]